MAKYLATQGGGGVEVYTVQCTYSVQMRIAILTYAHTLHAMCEVFRKKIIGKKIYLDNMKNDNFVIIT
jgi:hypothetical protein